MNNNNNSNMSNDNNQDNQNMSDDIYKDYAPKNNNNNNQNNNNYNNGYNNNMNMPYANNITNQGYQEKQYNSGFLKSHTKVEKYERKNHILLFGFYALVLVIGGIVALMILTNKYQFYFKKDEVVINQGSTYQLELTPKNAGSFDYLNYKYSMGDESIATVDEYGTVHAVGIGTTNLKVKMKRGLVSKTMKITVDNIIINGIVLKVQRKDKMESVNVLDMQTDETVTIHAFPDDRDDLNLSVSYSSSDTDVAIIDEFGNVTAKKTGVAIITGTLDGVSGQMTVRVNGTSVPIPKPTSKPSNTTAPTVTQKPVVTSKPSNTTAPTVTQKPVVTPKPSATTKPSSTKKPTTTTKPSTINIESISFSTSNVTVKVGNAYQLVVNVKPSNATEKELVFSSSNPSVAGVSNSGVISGLKAGEATITVKNKSGTKSATCKVKVVTSTSTSSTLKGVDIGIVQTTKYVGEKLQLKAKLNPADAKVSKITWTSSNTSVATVSSEGLVSMKSPGTVTITVTADKEKSSGTIIVKAKTTATPTPNPTTAPASTFNKKYVKVSTQSITVKKGSTASFTIELYNAAGVFAIKSSNTGIAKVDKAATWLDGVDDDTGKEFWDKKTIQVSGVAAGTTTIVITPDETSGIGTYDKESVSITGKHVINVTVK